MLEQALTLAASMSWFSPDLRASMMARRASMAPVKLSEMVPVNMPACSQRVSAVLNAVGLSDESVCEHSSEAPDEWGDVSECNRR